VFKKTKFVVAILTLIGTLFGCKGKGPEILDGPGMVYMDTEYRTEFANALPIEGWTRGEPMWAVAFLGYGKDGKANRKNYIDRLFADLPLKSVETIQTFEYDGDEWYLVVPRYKEVNDIVLIDGDKVVDSVYHGEAFFVRCNLSDLHSNIKIKVDSHGGHSFSPQVDGKGCVVETNEVWDIT